MIAFVAETKEIVHSWFHCGSALLGQWDCRVHEGVYGIYEEVGPGNLSRRQRFFLQRVTGLPRVSVSGIPYQGLTVSLRRELRRTLTPNGEVEESGGVAKRPEMGGCGRGYRVGASRLCISMCLMEARKTICGSTEVAQKREGIV